LVTERILAVPGVGFAMPGYFRLSYCVDEDIIRRSMPGFPADIRTIELSLLKNREIPVG
jgi:aspartate aminotransferase